MATYKTNWKDRIWLVWFALHIAVIVFVDAVPYYPRALYEPPGSPLHALQRLRAWYAATYDDPIVQWTSPASSAAGGGTWVPLFAHLELLLQLPTAAYGVWLLGWRRSRGAAPAATTGPAELLFLVYALETALSTLVCVNDVLWWDAAVVPAAARKSVFLYQLYGPWLAVPSAMFADMYWRLLSRVGQGVPGEAVKKTQ